MPNLGGVGTTRGGGSAESLAHNSAAKDDVLTAQKFTIADLTANDPGSAHNFTFIDNHVVANGDGTYSVAEGFSGFAYQVQMANGTWSEANVTQLGHVEQLLTNFSFENGTTGWTNVTGVPMEIVPAGYFGIGGDGHFLDTQATPGGVTIAQTVDVQTGEHAKLSISVAAENGAGGLHPGSTLSFTFNGVVVLSITENDFKDANGNVVYDQLKTFSVDVVGQAGSDTLVIHDDGTGSVGYGLDWVKLDAWVV